MQHVRDEEPIQPECADATRFLADHLRGDARAADRLLPLVYDELKRIATGYMREERRDHSLQPTAVVHEAYLRLVDVNKVDWKTRSHFLAMAARTMRRVLVGHARGRGAAKRGGRLQRIELGDPEGDGVSAMIDVLALENALEELAALDERQARVIELRFFGGLTLDETARLCGVSRDTVKLDWRMARAWLNRRLAGGDAEA